MAKYREIVSKTVLGKGKKRFINKYSITTQEMPSTILGCWVINHKFSGVEENKKIRINGTFDVNIWYSYDNDTKTSVAAKQISYEEVVAVKTKDDLTLSSNNDVIVRSLIEPSCSDVFINGNGDVDFTIEKELGIEIVGDAKIKILTEDDEEPWDIIEEDLDEKVSNEIDASVEEKFID